ncbi:MAG: hypothetical protein PHP04_07475 [Bacteroidales bacterium]|nr:hypothetical protein [Bacteroidales bacterium]
MKPVEFLLQDVFDVIKIITIPVIGFFLYQFYIGVIALKKSVDKLIIQMQCRETYCAEKHKEIGEHLYRHDAGIEEMKITLGDHGERISKVEGQLSK